MRNLTILALAASLALPAFAQTGAPPPGQGPGMGLPATRDEATGRARERFVRLDRNRDGFLTADEVPTRGGPARGDLMLQRLDTDKDGKLSAAEFEQQALAMFDRMDTDHDGKISPSERDSWRAQMMQPGGPGGQPRDYN
jgi:hypothetical protein